MIIIIGLVKRLRLNVFKYKLEGMPTLTRYTGKLKYALLEQYDLDTGIATGITKPNVIGDPDYIPPQDSPLCPTRYSRWVGDEFYCEDSEPPIVAPHNLQVIGHY